MHGYSEVQYRFRLRFEQAIRSVFIAAALNIISIYCIFPKYYETTLNIVSIVYFITCLHLPYVEIKGMSKRRLVTLCIRHNNTVQL